MSLILFFTLAAVALFAGFPIAIAFLSSSLAYFILEGLSLSIMVNVMINEVDSFILLAIPFFVFAANIMEKTKITDILFDFANDVVGHLPGGLSHVNILSSVIFAGMSGSAVADTSGIGYLATDAMIKKGFGKPFSAALTIASATIGPIIPPSIVMVLYADVTDTSLGELFIAGIIPGIIMGLALMIYCVILSLIEDLPRSSKTEISELLSSFKCAFFPLLTPIILVGGIYTGIFTPTEAAAVASLYAIIVGIFMGNLDLPKMIEVCKRTISFTGMVMIIIATAGAFSYIISREQIPQELTMWLLEMDLSRPMLLLVLNLAFIFLGSIFDTNTLILIFVPIVVPVLQQKGIDLVHFGVLITLNAMIGLKTPPFGMQLFVISGLTKIPIKDIFLKLWPMLLILIATLLLFTFIEPLVMWLPGTMW